MLFVFYIKLMKISALHQPLLYDRLVMDKMKIHFVFYLKDLLGG